MEYIKELNINEAVIHILDSNSDEPLLNEFSLQLNEEIYYFILKHIQKSLNDEELKYAVFKEERNIVKEISQEYFDGKSSLLETSKKLANQMFRLIKSNGSIPSCDFMLVSFSTEFGEMIGILKMDYIKNYTHSIEFVDDKMGINIIPQMTGLPGSSQRLQKCAFIKPVMDGQKFNLMVIDKSAPSKNKDDYASGADYFINNFLCCNLVDNERDMTKGLINATEKWTRNNFKEDADKAEVIRSSLKKKLKEEDSIELKALSEELFQDQFEAQKNFIEYVSAQGVSDNINVDKQWVDKKLKRVRLKIDKDIDLYINSETYNNNDKFEIQRNGDGSINIVLKHVINYIEK